MSDEFIGRGWAFPLRTDATGGIALVVARARDRGGDPARSSAPRPASGPMRPEFGCRIHDYVFASADGATARAIAAEVREALRRWEPRIDVDDVDVTFDAARPGASCTSTSSYAIKRDQRPPQPRVPVLRDPGRRLTMALPVPNLDDRRFQDLVDDAKRLVQQRCPEWTDHNVSDPGVTLIEMFAWMTDQLLYRLNRVPDRNYVKFLELIGVSLFPPTAARTPGDVLARRRRSRTSSRSRPATQVATVRTETDEAIVFTTVEDLPIIPSRARRARLDDRRQDAARPHGRRSRRAPSVYCFQEVPPPGRRAVRRPVRGRPVERGPAAVQAPTSRASASTRPTRRSPGRRGPATTGSRASSTPTRPAASTATATSSSTCPRGHVASLIAKQRGRLAAGPGHGARRGPARLQRLAEHQGPRARSRSAAPSTRSTPSWSRTRRSAISEGVPGQRFLLKRGPVVPGDDDRGPRGRRRRGLGRVDLGARLRRQRPGRPALHARRCRPARSGSGRRSAWPTARSGSYGAVPAEGRAPPAARVPHRRRPARQRRRARAISVLKSSIPFVARVENRRPARGGVDGEDIENAKVRGPIRLRTRGRAVTTEDYEQLAREAAPEVARVRAVAAGDGADAGSVRVLVVPSAVSERRAAPVRPARPQPGHAPEDHRPARGEPRHRHARDRRAARLPRRHGRRQAAGALARSTRPGSRRTRCSRCTSTSTRSPAAPTAPAGRSGGRSTPARSTRCSRASAAPSSSRTPGCSAPTR